MDGPFSFTEAPEEYLDFLREKRSQVIQLVVGSVTFGAAAAVIMAVSRGSDASEALPGVEAMAALFTITVVGLSAYGFTQGGTKREV
mmetsp:Transcript_110508/g.344484  ORF Transcript_110508/g.344484 Transcript_110508/m.344484 type:complete len:87 (+) Transcript_110508:213-473(+)